MRSAWIALLAAACSFDHMGVSGNGGADAATRDAPPFAIDSAVDSGPSDACVPDPLGELCNGRDDDCDGEIDETFPDLGDACDGDDSDLCLDDTVLCNATGLGTACGAGGDDDVERCNSLDDDCDGDTDEDFPTLGDACDAPTDTDSCPEGVVICSPDGAGVTCEEELGDQIEICNSFDDDCDGMTDEGFMLGSGCDGADTDLCIEGTYVCDGAGGSTCSDVTSSSVEACNLVDDDCDGMTDEGFDLASDESNCGSCGTTCTNSYGTNTCLAGACTPTCSGGGARDCDGNPNNGCEPRNTDPVCVSPTVLGSVDGDSFSPDLMISGYGEAWFLVHVVETDFTDYIDQTARITLASPTGVNMNLYVYCASCGGSLAGSSTNLAGLSDTVNVSRTDLDGNTSYDVVIEVRYVSQSACGDWTLTVQGDVFVALPTCT